LGKNLTLRRRNADDAEFLRGGINFLSSTLPVVSLGDMQRYGISVSGTVGVAPCLRVSYFVVKLTRMVTVTFPSP